VSREPTEPDDVGAAVARAFRQERAGVLATLIRQVGDFQLAEDALQDAFVAALAAWGPAGVPASPRAWLITTARRRAVDRVRHDRSLAGRALRLAELTAIDGDEDEPAPEDDAMDALDDGGRRSAVVDDRLRLIFTCCHPALSAEARVALTLRIVGGLTTAEIARAFLVTEPTMGKRIVRAKRKIAEANIPYRVPPDSELPERLRGVLRVVYLIFNEGYAASGGDRLVRHEVCGEAVRLGRLLTELMPDEAEAWGLLALMLLHDARREARTDAAGHYQALEDQNRSRWDRRTLDEARRCLDRALQRRRPGPYQIEAAITALHVEGAEAGATDWAQIADLYRQLLVFRPSPVVRLNHAAAVGFAAGPWAGLALVEPLLADPALTTYQPLHATHADLLRRVGDIDTAAEAYDQAIALTGNDVERAELERRRRLLRPVPGR
jgi:RNA polymerase sigma-70 factor (ECF subfamily)